MTQKKFLGKPVPSQKLKLPRKQAAHSSRFFALLVLPVVACGALLALQKNTLQHGAVAERSTGNALSITLAADAIQPVAPAGDPSKYCNATMVRDAFMESAGNGQFKLKNIFPIVPNELNGLDSKGNPITPTGSNSTSYCTPAYWGREVAYLFIYKTLAVLNWVAEAIAIIYSLYAGILYILGAFNEGNVKKAKGILIGVYGGLIIVLLAKTLVYSTISVIVRDDPYNLVGRDKALQAPNIPGVNGNPATPTP